MASAAALDRANLLNGWLCANVGGKEGPNNLRSRCAGACLMVCCEHFSAICLLAREGAYSSAFALARVVWESYINGVWLLHCADDHQLTMFSEGNRHLPKVPKMIKELERNDTYSMGTLSKIQRQSWEALNGYTHSGSLLVQRWNSADDVGPDFGTDEVDEILAFTSMVALLAGTGMAILLDDLELAEGLAPLFEQHVGISP